MKNSAWDRYEYKLKEPLLKQSIRVLVKEVNHSEPNLKGVLINKISESLPNLVNWIELLYFYLPRDS